MWPGARPLPPFPPPGRPPIVAGNITWFGHDDTSVRGITRDGKVIWEHRLGTPIKTAPVVTGNLLLVHDFAGNLWCFEGVGNDGNTESRVQSRPALFIQCVIDSVFRQ